MKTNTNWEQMQLSADTVGYLRGTHKAWSRIADGEHIFVICPNHETPSPTSGGYFTLGSALRAKGLTVDFNPIMAAVSSKRQRETDLGYARRIADTQSAASNPQEQASTTAKTLTKEKCECEDCLREEREEATSEWYDENERRYRLADEGRTFDGEGESYAERNA